MTQKKDACETAETESFHDFYVLKDMFDFENVGFCNTVGNLKYLACADCEVGPIGYMDVGVKDRMYVCVDRIALQ